MRTALYSLFGLGLATAAAMFWLRGSASSAAAPSDTGTTRIVRRDIVTAVKATGIVRPMIGAEVKVGSRVSGVVQRLLVRVGDSVRPGQLLAAVDARDLAARRDDAAAALALADANCRYAEADRARRRELLAAGLLARGDWDLAEQASAVAEQQRARARAALDLADTQLGYARIVAPMAGVVASVSTQEGETAAASFAAPTFVTLVDLSRLEVRAYVDETDIGRIRPGQRALFSVDTYPGVEFEGRVETVYPQAEIRDNVVNYVTVIRFAPPRDHLIRPEMTASVRVLVDVRAQVPALPLRAVQRADGRSFVWCRRGSAPERCWITTGSRDDAYWEITSGLTAGDSVDLPDAAAGASRGAP